VDEQPVLVTAEWVAERLGIFRKSVTRAAAEGRIPGAVKIEGVWRFDPSLIVARSPDPPLVRPILSVNAVAERWGVSAGEVQHRAKSGKLPGVKVGLIWQFALADVEAYETARVSEMLFEPDLTVDDWTPIRQALRQAIRAQLRPRETLKPYCRRTGLPYQSIVMFLIGRAIPQPITTARLRIVFGDRLPPMPGEERNIPTVPVRESDRWRAFRHLLRDDWDPKVETLKSFARRLGLAEATIRDLITADRDPTAKTIGVLLGIYGDRLLEAVGDFFDLLTPQQAAAVLGITTMTLKKWRREGRITPVAVGKRSIRYLRPDAIALREELDRTNWQPPQPRPPEASHPCAAGCGQIVVDQRDQPHFFCSLRCENLHAVRSIVPKTPRGWALKSLVLADLEVGENLPSICQRIGISRTVLLAVIRGRPLLDKTLKKLELAYPDRLPSGSTASDALRQRFITHPPKNNHSAEALAKRSQTTKLRRAEHRKYEAEIIARDEHDPERIALLEKKATTSIRMQQAHATSPASIAHRQRHAERMRSLSARVQMSVKQRLVSLERQRPENPIPTSDEREQWKQAIATRLEVPPAEVARLWRPVLIKHKLLNPGGRPRKDEVARCEAYQGLKQKREWDGIGRAPHRFDVDLGDLFDVTYTAARDWRLRHDVTPCPRCATPGPQLKFMGNS